MLKTSDIPAELRGINNQFNHFGYKYEITQVFDDFLTLVICCMGRGTNEELYFETIKRYKKEEIKYFSQMLVELILLYEKAEKKGKWCDPLGNFYEALASGSKKSGLGQFFTPEDLCTMIAQMMVSDEWGLTINEPCSGSGRMVLAADNKTKGNYYVCEDIDPICAKMTAINMCFHKIKGEVHCRDVLMQDKPRFSYAINHQLWKVNIIHIIQVKPS
jgi:type I restriction enzyme M protein